MNILNTMRGFWAQDRQVEEAPSAGANAKTHLGSAAVLQFPIRPSGIANLPPANAELRAEPGAAERGFPGLLDMPEIEAFLSASHFGLGRHNGASLRSIEALERELQTISARFQGLLWEQIERKRTRIDRMQRETLRTAGLSEQITAQLKMAVTQLDSEIERLRDQVTAAARGEGWVRPALELYRTGFLKGMQEALEFELLGH